ncbi:exported hypothetical protein [Gammaproteobacteria bacterium]
MSNKIFAFVFHSRRRLTLGSIFLIATLLGSTPTQAASGTASFSYDAVGNLVSVVRSSSGSCSVSSKGWIYKAYIGYYNRCPEKDGLEFWCGKLDSAGGDLGAIISAFGTSQEYTRRFGNLSDSDLISNLYQNMFSRSPESEGLSFYVSRLSQLRQDYANSHGGSSSGATEYALSRIALDVLNGASGGDVTTLNGKIMACPVF